MATALDQIPVRRRCSRRSTSLLAITISDICPQALRPSTGKRILKVPPSHCWSVPKPLDTLLATNSRCVHDIACSRKLPRLSSIVQISISPCASPTGWSNPRSYIAFARGSVDPDILLSSKITRSHPFPLIHLLILHRGQGGSAPSAHILSQSSSLRTLHPFSQRVVSLTPAFSQARDTLAEVSLSWHPYPSDSSESYPFAFEHLAPPPRCGLRLRTRPPLDPSLPSSMTLGQV